MEIDSAIRNADNRIIAGMAVAFAGLVFVIGVASGDVPADVPMTEATFDVAPPIVAAPTGSEAGDTQATAPFTRLAAVAKRAVPPKDETWYADDAAHGARPDSQH